MTDPHQQYYEYRLKRARQCLEPLGVTLIVTFGFGLVYLLGLLQ